MHSLISSRPRSNYYTNGENIFFEKPKGEKIYELPDIEKVHKEDIAIEDFVLYILDAAPANIPDSYEEIDGHLRLADFSTCFKGRPHNHPYFDQLRTIKTEIPYALIRKLERKRLEGRIITNQDHLGKLLIHFLIHPYN